MPAVTHIVLGRRHLLTPPNSPNHFPLSPILIAKKYSCSRTHSRTFDYFQLGLRFLGRFLAFSIPVS